MPAQVAPIIIGLASQGIQLLWQEFSPVAGGHHDGYLRRMAGHEAALKAEASDSTPPQKRGK